jgi:kinesin family protein 5
MTSLRFGMRAKLIKNEPKVQEEQTITEVLELLKKAEKKIKEQNDIINELKKYIQKNLNNFEDF